MRGSRHSLPACGDAMKHLDGAYATLSAQSGNCDKVDDEIFVDGRRLPVSYRRRRRGCYRGYIAARGAQRAAIFKRKCIVGGLRGEWIADICCHVEVVFWRLVNAGSNI